MNQLIKKAKLPPSDNISYFVRGYNYITDQISRRHVHPITVHISNGLLPVSVIFIVLAMLSNFNPLAQAAFYNMRVVLMAMPIVLFSGYIDWQNRYNGKLSYRFVIKMVCGSVVLLSSLILVIWQIIDPAVMVYVNDAMGFPLTLFFIACCSVYGRIPRREAGFQR